MILEAQSDNENPKPFILPSSIEDEVFAVLRDRIVRGYLRPGQPLVLADLSREFGVSTMPIRSALVRLEAEGLVTRLLRRTVTVSPLRLDDLEEIQALRMGVEGFLAFYGAPLLSDSDIEAMRSQVASLEQDVLRGDVDAYQAKEWMLHKTCYQRSDRERLLELAIGYRQRADRYLHLVLGTPEGLTESFAFQKSFATACERRSGEDTESVLVEAFRWTISQFRGAQDGDMNRRVESRGR